MGGVDLRCPASHVDYECSPLAGVVILVVRRRPDRSLAGSAGTCSRNRLVASCDAPPGASDRERRPAHRAGVGERHDRPCWRFRTPWLRPPLRRLRCRPAGEPAVKSVVVACGRCADRSAGSQQGTPSRTPTTGRQSLRSGPIATTASARPSVSSRTRRCAPLTLSGRLGQCRSSRHDRRHDFTFQCVRQISPVVSGRSKFQRGADAAGWIWRSEHPAASHTARGLA